tara:strand:- start:1694 stop:2008 length:315 start_codon:yes stop_codon:yes gene_type:complete
VVTFSKSLEAAEEVEVAKVVVVLVEAVQAVNVVRMDSADPKVVALDRMVIPMVMSAEDLVTMLQAAVEAVEVTMQETVVVTLVAIVMVLLEVVEVTVGHQVHTP